jgi:RNA polymerase sigma factor (sigma-70 family)
MSNVNRSPLLRSIGRIFNRGSLTGLGEADLLREVANGGDEAAFEVLVGRYGPLVLAACRRLLSDQNDVEDAFQATFLVLLRKAGSLRGDMPLSPWLHAVASRVAARIRSTAARRPAQERKAARLELVETAWTPEQRELRGVIDEEIGRLPERYRRAVVLCLLEGRTHEEAARRLRCSTGVVRGRLDRARERLRRRLTTRGMAPGIGLIGSVLTADVWSAVPPPMIAATVATLGRYTTARAVSSGISATILALADGVFTTMILSKVKAVIVTLVAGVALLSAGAAAIAILPHAIEQEENARRLAAPESTDPSKIALTVVDRRTGKPLAGVAVIVKIDTKETTRGTTNQSGKFDIPIPNPAPEVSIEFFTRKDGFAPMLCYTRRPTVVEDIPAAYTLAITPIETLSGTVRDEKGQPITDVEVEPRIWILTAASAFPVREEFDTPGSIRTDNQGRWSWDGLPAGIEPNRVSLRFAHRDYQRLDLPMETALETIRRNGVTVLSEGLEIMGTVLDPVGKPIPRARVSRGSTHAVGDSVSVETDVNGRFRVAHVPSGDSVITVVAPGFAPDLKIMNVQPGKTALEFHLEKGRTIGGTVVDRQAKPLAGATVYVAFWRQSQSLQWKTTTDDRGQFQWRDAPKDAFSLSVTLGGHQTIYGHTVPEDVGELSFTLVQPLRVRGTVVDAETRHAIKAFTLVPGTENSGGFPTYWQRDETDAQRSLRDPVRRPVSGIRPPHPHRG